MTTGAPEVDHRVASRGLVLAPHLSAKFALPAAPAAMVLRVGLTDRLAAAGGPAVVSVVAPAGYGKTTLLRLWADRQPSVAYVALEDGDSDPVRLLSSIATSLDRVEPLDPGILRLIGSPGQSLESTLLPGLVETIWARRTPTVLMLDDAHRLEGSVPLDVIAFLMLHLPTNLRLALTARRVLPLPFARLRVAGHLLELDARDLALDAVAARTMAAAMGVVITDDDIAGVLTQTEGWPAATYLGLRSLGAVGRRHQPGDELRGTERTIADYMRSELLEPLDAESQRWLLRSSVLDVMTGPLCDAALKTSGSLALLRLFEDDNLLVVAVDAHRDAYRYHRLFRDLLRDELDIREPGAAAEASARAAAWCAENNQPEDAVDYARASGDMDLLARLVLRYAFPMHYSGRGATLSHWFDWFDHDGQRDRRAAIAVLAGWVNAMDGRTREATDWLASAERSPDASPMPDGTSKVSWLAVLRGYMAPAGMPTLMSDARTALAGIAENSPFRQGALVLAGLADIAAGVPHTADALLAEAADVAETRGAMPGLALALGERALIALARSDVTAAKRHVERALGPVRAAGMQDHVASAVLHVANARTALATGSPAEARLAIAQLNRMRPRLTTALPVIALQVRLEAIRVCLVLREVGAARVLLLEARAILHHRPDLGTLVQEAAELERLVESTRASAAGPWTLTAAELRLLAYLPTHLSFREIAERLFVSPHTIKSQAMAVYGKLGVASRRGAIEQAVEAGLLDTSVIRMPGATGGVG